MAGTPFPLQDYQIAEPNGKLTLAWAKLLTLMWQLTGGQVVPTVGSVVLRLLGGQIQAYNATSGVPIGIVPLEDLPGSPAQPVAVGASPQVYTAGGDGMLVVFGAAVDFSRNAGVTWYQVTLQGGALPMKKNDKARTTWYSATKPTVTWFPDWPQ